MSLSKEQKAAAVKRLNSQFGGVHFTCDGYKVTLKLERFKMKLVVAAYVNGGVSGEWFLKPEENPESKFFATRYKSFFSAKCKAEIIKALGKRQANRSFELDKKIEYKLPYFNTPLAAINHMIKVSDSIELAGEAA